MTGGEPGIVGDDAIARAPLGERDALEEAAQRARQDADEGWNAGGVLGGISTGAPIVVRAAFKPTPSIRLPLQTINTAGENVMVSTKGRHDPCVALRAGPIVEAMVALVLADHKLVHRAQCGAP